MRLRWSGRSDLPAILNRVQQQHDLSVGMWDAVLSEMANVPKDVQEVAGEQRSYGNMPLVVLTAGAAESDGAAQIGAGKTQIAAANRLWKEALAMRTRPYRIVA